MPILALFLGTARASQRVLFLGALATLAALSGCASVTVHEKPLGDARAPSRPPARIYVQEFTIRDRDFRVHQGDQGTARVAQATATRVSQQIVSGLNQHVVAAELIKPGAALPAGSWVLRGQFQRVNSGSATLRILVGLGAGGSKMETHAVLAQAGRSGHLRPPFLQFQTTGGSGAEAGLVTIPLGGPVGAPMLIYQVGSTVYSGASKGVGDDAARTARMIVAATSEYFTRRGFPVRGQPLVPKHDWTAALHGH